MRKLLVVCLILVVTLLGGWFTVPLLANYPDDGETNMCSGIYLDQPTLGRVAQALELTQKELLLHLEDGESISEIATTQNVPEDEVVEALIIPYRDELQLQMKYSYISQQQVDVLLEQVRVHARYLLDEDLSGTEKNGSYSWEEMVNDCNELMGDWEVSQNSWGGTNDGIIGVRG